MGVTIRAVRHRGFRDFSFACRELASLTGADMKDVIDNEAAAVLQEAASNTKVAKPNKIINDHNRTEWVTYEIPYGGSVQGQQSYFAAKAATRRSSSEVSPKLRYNLRWRMPNWLYQEIRRRRRDSLKKKLERAGLSAKHWYEQAVQLGYQIKVESRVKNAKHDRPIAVRTRRRSQESDYQVSGENYSELSNRHAGGEKALKRAVSRRVSLFQRSMKNWARGRVDLVARRYPRLLRVY